VSIIAQDFYSAFILQARAGLQADGSAALVGSFETIPSVAQVLRIEERYTVVHVVLFFFFSLNWWFAEVESLLQYSRPQR
jgi:hypothetical protein